MISTSTVDSIQSIQGYELLERIKSGGFGTVYRGKQKSAFDREVAIKVILPQYANKPEFIRRFEAEAELISRLEHPHIVPLYDYWRDPKGAYLIMRYLRGSIRDALTEKVFSLQEASVVLDQVASALDLAHRNQVVHRDIKPGNILLDENGIAYVADFGIAKDLLKTYGDQTAPKSVVGSLDYISPEQARSEPVSGRTDIYSLGVMLYEMIIGQHPFSECSSIERLYKHINEPLPEITTLDASVCDGINGVIQKATTKNPLHRYDDVIKFAQAFRLAANLDITQPENSLVEQLTLKEHEVLQHLVDGLTNREIASQLFVTPSTVRFHLKNIYKKLNVHTRVQAIIRARELDLIDVGNLTLDSESSSILLHEPDNPYKGLKAFQTADAQDFFGRDDVIERLRKKMQETHEYYRFLAIIGPSGSGKSSLVKAGLIPALWRGALSGSEKWYVVEMRPGNHPIDQLEIALTRVASDQSDNIYQHLQRDHRGLVRVSDLILPDDDTELVIYVDQFEEVFTLCDDEAERLAFLNLLYYTTTAPRSRVRIIVTLRADYYDKPLYYHQFGVMLRSRIETLLPLGAEALSKAIMGPAHRVGVDFEKGLVSSIVSEMTYHTNALPLMQYALTELFNQRDNRLMTFDCYRNIGGAVGALTSQAEALYQNLDADARLLTRQLFLRLVTVLDANNQTRRRVLSSEIFSITDNTDLIQEIIDAFADKRLLALDYDARTRQPTIEVAHEAILSEWVRLRNWFEESYEDILMERRLAQQTELWLDSNRDQSYLLTGARLKTFEDWMTVTDINLTNDTKSFIEISRMEHDASKKIELRRERALRYLSYGLILILTIAVFVSTSLSLFAMNRERAAIAAQQTSVFNAEEARQLAQVNGVYAALAQDERALAISLGLSANLEDEPHPLAYQALADAAYPPGVVDVITSEFNGVPYNNGGNLTLTRDGRQLIHPFSAASFDADYNGVAVYNVDRNSPDFGSLLRIDTNYETVPITVGLMPDEQTIVVVEWSGQITMRDFYTFEVLHEFDIVIGEGSGKPTLFNPHPDGTRAVTNDDQYGVYVWDVNRSSPTVGQILAHYPDIHESWVMQVTFDHAGQRILSAAMDGTLVMINSQTGEQIHTFSGHSGPVMVGTFSPDDKRMVSAGFDGSLIIWNTDESSASFGEEIHRMSGHSNLILQIAFGADGNTLLTSGWDGRILLWNIDESTRVVDGVLRTAGRLGYGTIISEFKVEAVNGVALSPDGRTGYTVQFDLIAWDLYAGNLIKTYSWEDFAGGIDYNVTGDLAALATHQEVLLIDTTSGEPVRTLPASDNMIFDVVFSSEGSLLASAADDGRIMLWDADPQSATFGQLIRTMTNVPRTATTLLFSPDDRYLYGTLLTSGTIVQWDVTTGDLLRSYVINSPEFLRSIDLHPRGDMIAMSYQANFGGAYDAILLYDLSTGTPLQTLTINSGAGIVDVTFTPDGAGIISGDADGAVRIWSVETGELLQEFLTDDSIISVVMHPNMSRLYVGQDAGDITIFDVALGIAVGTISNQDGRGTDLVIDPLGRTLLSSSSTAGALWRLDERATLVNWTQTNRLSRGIPCAERLIYGIEQVCDPEGNLPEETVTFLLTPPPLTAIVNDFEMITFNTPLIDVGNELIIAGEYQDTVAIGQSRIYRYEGVRGETLSITVTAESVAQQGYRMLLHAQSDATQPVGFDPIVFISDPDGRLLTAVESPDTTVVNYVYYPGSNNTEDDLNVSFEITLPETATYEIAISGEGFITGGDYTLTLESIMVED